MKKNRREYKDGSCFKTRNKYIKQKYQIKLELIGKNSSKEFKNCREYNRFLNQEAERIYNEQFQEKK